MDDTGNHAVLRGAGVVRKNTEMLTFQWQSATSGNEDR